MKSKDGYKHKYRYEYCSRSDYTALPRALDWINECGFEIVAITQTGSDGFTIFYDANPKD